MWVYSASAKPIFVPDSPHYLDLLEAYLCANTTFQHVLDAIAAMRPFQYSIVVVLKSCRLRLKMANASATLATRFHPLAFLHAFAHGPVC